MTTAAFEQFLIQRKSKIFEPGAPANEQHTNALEIRLGVPLPVSYKTFLRVCGPGYWAGNNVVSPEDVYAFDENADGMDGFVTLIHNVGGVGDYVAFNPHEQTGPGEWALHYCSHDPLGCARIADSFESWAREAVTAFEENRDLYAKAAEEVRRTWRRGLRARIGKWFQFRRP